MAKNVLVRNIDEDTLEKLKKKAAANNRSLQKELKLLLEQHAGPSREEIKKRIEEFREKLRKSGQNLPDSTEEIRKMREERINRLL